MNFEPSYSHLGIIPEKSLNEENQQQRTNRKGSRVLDGGGVVTPFPEKLHHVLSSRKYDDIISWNPDGISFALHNNQGFVVSVMPVYFKQTKLRSFQRQLCFYGFKRIDLGSRMGGYHHPKFLRDDPNLCKTMRRVTVQSQASKRNITTVQPTSMANVPAPALFTFNFTSSGLDTVSIPGLLTSTAANHLGYEHHGFPQDEERIMVTSPHVCPSSSMMDRTLSNDTSVTLLGHHVSTLSNCMHTITKSQKNLVGHPSDTFQKLLMPSTTTGVGGGVNSISAVSKNSTSESSVSKSSREQRISSSKSSYMIQHQNNYASPIFSLGYNTQCGNGYHHHDNEPPNQHHFINPFDDDYNDDDDDDDTLSDDLSSYFESSNADFHCDFDTIFDDY